MQVIQKFTEDPWVTIVSIVLAGFIKTPSANAECLHSRISGTIVTMSPRAQSLEGTSLCIAEIPSIITPSASWYALSPGEICLLLIGWYPAILDSDWFDYSEKTESEGRVQDLVARWALIGQLLVNLNADWYTGAGWALGWRRSSCSAGSRGRRWGTSPSPRGRDNLHSEGELKKILSSLVHSL